MRKHAPLVVILLVAAIVRYWAIAFCLPGQLCRPDEEAVAGIVTQFFGRDLNPHFFDWPTLFMYATTAGVVAFFQVGRGLGWFRGELHFLQLIVVNMTPVYLTARILSATAGVASVWVLFRIARRLFNETTALVAAFFLALAFLHARDSHFGVTDVPATFLALVAFLFIVRLRETGRTFDLIASGLFTGLAASTKYNAALIALPAVWVIASREWRTSRRLLFKELAWFGALVVLAFAITSPYCLIDFTQFAHSLRAISEHLAGGHGVVLGRGWAVHLTSSLRYGLGVPLLAAGIVGMILLFVRSPDTGILVALFPVLYYVIVGAGYTVFARYILPVVPFLCLTAAFAVVEGARAFANAVHRARWADALTWSAALLVIAPSAWSLAQFDHLLGVRDSRLVAADWVREHFPNGATIAESGNRSTNLFFLRESADRPSRYTTLALNSDADTVGTPDILVVPSSLFDRDAPTPPRAEAMAGAYAPMVVVDAQSMNAEGVVYDWQDQFYLPLRGFRDVWRPGPNLTIYVRPDLAKR